MHDLLTQPDIDQRELLESIAREAVPAAVDEVVAALARLPSPAAAPRADAQLGGFATGLLRAVLTLYVQGALSVRERNRLISRARHIADRPLVHEVLRSVRLVGVNVLAAHVQRTAPLSRAEHLRLRESAERLEALVMRLDDEPPPRRDDVLKRLHATGCDLR